MVANDILASMDEPISTPEPSAEIPAPLEALPLTGPAEPAPEAALAEVLTAESAPEVMPDIPTTEPTATAEVVPSEPETHTAPQPPATSSSPAHSAREDSAKGNAAKKQKIEQHLEKILVEAKKKKTITYRDVVKLLRISDATASRYLKMLVARGQLKREGKGRSVRYSV